MRDSHTTSRDKCDMKQRRESERVIPINDVIVVRDVYLRLEVQDWAFNRLEAFERERCLFS